MSAVRSVKTKILALSIGAVLLTAAALVSVVLVQKVTLRQSVNEELDVLAENETAKIAKDVYLMCRAVHEGVQQKVSSDLKLAQTLLTQKGPVSLSDEEVTWTAIDQSTHATKQVTLPKMMAGDKWLGEMETASNQFPVVDKTKEISGSICTVFQRMNESGDMLRISTTALKSDGTREIGTYIPAVDIKGVRNPVIAATLNGRTYTGRASVLGDWCVTAYEPIHDTSNRVVGILGIAVREESVESLRKGIMDVTVGKTGYVYIVGGSGAERGQYIISYKGERDGENIWDAKDAEGNLFIQNVVKKAVATKDGSVDFEHYPWKNVGENQARNKLAAVTYFEPWDWVIGAGAYEDDFRDAQIRVASALNTMVSWTVIGSVLLVILFAAFSTVLATRIANPLRQAAGIAEAVAQGDLTTKLEINQADEVGQLAASLNTMEDRLIELIRSIQSSANQVSAASEELAASSQSLSSGATEQAANLEETSASIEELTASIQNNSGNANSAAETAIRCASEAEKGGESVMKTVEAMKRIAEQIGVIDDIADQTNLLALNAAIEAARAGELGKGFAVVAVEVRKLAERSQSAAQEISELAQRSVADAEDAGEMIQRIVPEIQQTANLVQEINSACEEQATGAGQISQAVTQLDEVTQRNAATSEETAASSEELSQRAMDMQEMVSQFNTGTDGKRLSHTSHPALIHAPQKEATGTHIGPDHLLPMGE